MNIDKLLTSIESLSVYGELKNDKIIKKLYSFLGTLDKKPIDIDSYSSACSILYSSEYLGNLADYILDAVLTSSNIFAIYSAKNEYDKLPENIKTAARNDLNTIYELAMLSSAKIKSILKDKQIKNIPGETIDLLPEYTNKLSESDLEGRWGDGDNLDYFINKYKNNGIGIFAKYRAFLFDNDGIIKPVANPDPIRLSDLKQYEVVRNKVAENTLGFIKKYPFNNVLLYGDRGTGKSSTVKAILNEYYTQGLRMIEISRKNLHLLDKLIMQIANIPMRFIIFIDDLTFNENDNDMNVLKAVLEGSINGRPDNIAVYATSNRRHLVKESFQAREGDEVHRGDTIDDTMSLSDRFGISVTFMKPNKDEYLNIVMQIAADRGLNIDNETLFKGAERFALLKGGRSPRLAKQYVDNIEARINLNLNLC